MDNTCKFAGGGYCLCGACQSMRETLEEMEKIDSEKIFKETEKIFEEMKKEGEHGREE